MLYRQGIVFCHSSESFPHHSSAQRKADPHCPFHPTYIYPYTKNQQATIMFRQTLCLLSLFLAAAPQTAGAFLYLHILPALICQPHLVIPFSHPPPSYHRPGGQLSALHGQCESIRVAHWPRRLYFPGIRRRLSGGHWHQACWRLVWHMQPEPLRRPRHDLHSGCLLPCSARAGRRCRRRRRCTPSRGSGQFTGPRKRLVLGRERPPSPHAACVSMLR